MLKVTTNYFGKIGMETQKNISDQAKKNYSANTPWPNADEWHSKTFQAINNIVNKELAKFDNENAIILNAGSGGTNYNHKGRFIHLDIIESYINKYPNYIVASIDNIPLESDSVDIIICVGSVINYADCQKSLKEFSRVLKANGILILEFERSNSGEFLFTGNHNKQVFSNSYIYNNQKHILWMYNEKHVIKIMRCNNLKTIRKYRFHTFSTLLYRLGLSEKSAAKYIKADKIFAPISYPLAHNCILISKKISKV